MKPSPPSHTQQLKSQASAEVVGVEVEEEEEVGIIVVEEEEEHKIRTNLKTGLNPNIRVPSILTFHPESGRGVESIISTGRMRTSVRNRRLVHGRM